MILAIGEILYDIFPDYQRIGGAPFNTAFHLKNLGMDVNFMSRVGNDPFGKKILNFIKEHKFDHNLIQIDDHHQTGKVIVELDESGIPTFDILKDCAYDHIDFSNLEIDRIKLIYFGSLLQRTPGALHKFQRTMEAKSYDTTCLCDINLRPDSFSATTVKSCLTHADILKLNDEELAIIQEILGYKSGDSFIFRLMDMYHIKIVALTKGNAGSELYQDGLCFSGISGEKIKLADTVGAGDAWSSILAAGYLNNLPGQKIVDIAVKFAGRICEIKGAIPNSADFYEPFKKLIEKENNA